MNGKAIRQSRWCLAKRNIWRDPIKPGRYASFGLSKKTEPNVFNFESARRRVK